MRSDRALKSEKNQPIFARTRGKNFVHALFKMFLKQKQFLQMIERKPFEHE